ncbi:MAG: prolipoprotein diacylglyceryl transferase family protein [Pseudomonadota bacterium]
MLPYIPNYIPIDYKLFGLIPIQPFGILVGLALVVGYFLSRRRARLVGLDPDVCADGVVWTSVVGFVVGHLVSVVFYFPNRIAENPFALLAIWSGLSSFGGFLGGALGAYYFFKRKQKVSVLQYAEAILFGLMPGWIVGRLGCTVVFDHPGKPTSFFLGMAYKNGQVLHNLGLYEMLYTVVLTGILYALKNVRPFYGFHFAIMLFLYAPIRFLLDYLRTADKLYFGLTPGQYFAVSMIGFSVTFVVYGLKLRARGEIPPKNPKPFVSQLHSYVRKGKRR